MRLWGNATVTEAIPPAEALVAPRRRGQWVKGQSGNPGGGRKKTKFSITTEAGKEAMASLQRLIKIRDDPSASNADRIRAANSILDRACGKPQTVLAGDQSGGPIKVVIDDRWRDDQESPDQDGPAAK